MKEVEYTDWIFFPKRHCVNVNDYINYSTLFLKILPTTGKTHSDRASFLDIVEVSHGVGAAYGIVNTDWMGFFDQAITFDSAKRVSGQNPVSGSLDSPHRDPSLLNIALFFQL